MVETVMLAYTVLCSPKNWLQSTVPYWYKKVFLGCLQRSKHC